MRATIIRWDGTNLPEELRQLPPGHYLLEVVDDREGDIAQLTPEEDAGLRLALDQVEAGEALPLDEVVLEIRRRHQRR